ncbi:hypothetical protein A2890_03025 [candidate division WWE3 bacterium RIFCSPLOWO2_01_FULL_53_14]|uniref:Uncharacterized protein n=1 Tax=candidate division WWE3 bacterium RIFCSPLOWO2_01_FULL_53_14 TaxID=1802628 RepID=A0A1F4VYX1_UNCKA|nr:MAG: hypothetical protein A2890_03025 [candidate division WWE3 bacterium RIFCSPLOWO2_01_FULL_53_14]
MANILVKPGGFKYSTLRVELKPRKKKARGDLEKLREHDFILSLGAPSRPRTFAQVGDSKQATKGLPERAFRRFRRPAEPRRVGCPTRTARRRKRRAQLLCREQNNAVGKAVFLIIGSLGRKVKKLKKQISAEGLKSAW